MKTGNKKILGIPLIILLGVLVIGFLFKVLHWEYGDLIIISSFTGIAILYSLRFYFKPNKTLLDLNKWLLVLFWSMNGIFSIINFPYQYIFQYLTYLSFISFIGLQVHYIYKEDPAKKNYDLTGKLLYQAAAIIIAIGIIFKILHWPYATYFLIGGMVLGSVYILKELLWKKNK